jgi:hypothetical protein
MVRDGGGFKVKQDSNEVVVLAISTRFKAKSF